MHRTHDERPRGLGGLLLAEDLHGFYAGGADGWHERSGGGYSQHEKEDGGEGGDVGWGDTVEEACEQATGDESQGPSSSAAREADSQALPENLFNDLAAEGAEGETEADFAAADVDGIAESAVEADAGEREGGGREEGEKDGAEAVFCQAVGEVLFERSEIEGGALRLDVVNLLADGFGHGHRSISCADKEIGARLGDGCAPIGGWNGRLIEAGFAGVAGDTDDLGWAGITHIQGLYVMANYIRTVEVGIGEGAIHDDGGGSIGLAADFAGEQRDAHGGEIAGRDETVLGDEFRFGVGAAFEELEFDLILEGHAGNAHGDGGGFDAWRGAKSFEDAVGELAESLHIAGFAPVHT